MCEGTKVTQNKQSNSLQVQVGCFTLDIIIDILAGNLMTHFLQSPTYNNNLTVKQQQPINAAA